MTPLSLNGGTIGVLLGETDGLDDQTGDNRTGTRRIRAARPAALRLEGFLREPAQALAAQLPLHQPRRVVLSGAAGLRGCGAAGAGLRLPRLEIGEKGRGFSYQPGRTRASAPKTTNDQPSA